jgi:hypothetical protein
MSLVGLGAMLVLSGGVVGHHAADVAGDSATPVKDLYGGGGVASVYLLRDQLVRHTVVVVVQFHVIVDVHP